MSVIERKITRKDGKDSLYLYVEIPLPNGKKLKRSIGKKGLVTRTQAKRVEQELKRKIKLGQLDLIQADIPTLKEFKYEYLNYVREVKQKRSWKRDEELLQPLCKLFGNKKISEITTTDIEDFKLIRLREVKPATVNRSLSVLRHLINVAKRWRRYHGENTVSIAGLLEENSKIERILTLEEEKDLIESAIDYIRLVILTALHTGMRRSEILNLRWSNVDLSNNLITVLQTNSKSKKERKIFVNSNLKKLLSELKLKAGGSEFVFIDNKGDKLNNIRTAFNAACRRANITGLRFHDLRHTVATRMIESGANIVAVSKILGHSDLKTTMRYTHPEEAVKDALENLANFRQTTTNIATIENIIN